MFCGFILKRAALGLLAAMAIGATASRTYSPDRFGLIIDGANCGFVRSVSGGALSADVVNENTQPIVKKHIAAARYEPFEIQLGLSNGKAIYEWINSTWQGKAQRKSGSIVAIDFDGKAQFEREFRDALLKETTIPTLDAASKEPFYLTVRIAPEVVRDKQGGSTLGPASKSSSKVMLSNFKLEMDGLDCSRVQRIDSFNVALATPTDAAGESRDVQKVPGKLQFARIVVTMPESAADTWQQWAEDFMTKGNNGDNHEKSATLSMLSSDMKTVVARIRMYNVGICRFEHLKTEAGGRNIGQVQAELYVERMEFELTGAGESVPSEPPPSGTDVIGKPAPARG